MTVESDQDFLDKLSPRERVKEERRRARGQAMDLLHEYQRPEFNWKKEEKNTEKVNGLITYLQEAFVDEGDQDAKKLVEGLFAQGLAFLQTPEGAGAFKFDMLSGAVDPQLKALDQKYSQGK